MGASHPPHGPWWSSGLAFACTSCGKCCEARGEYQHVYVNRGERRRLAEHLGLSARDFLERYTTADENGYRTLRFVEGRCPFLDGKLCRVHPVKPTQCRTWPFWNELLADPETYRREVLDFCPGSACGAVIPAARIRREDAATERALHDHERG